MALRVGFVGLGVMGLPMATNLVRAGMDVVGYNRSRPAVDQLTEAGGRGAASTAEAVTGVDVVITMLPDSPDVIDVYRGPGGVFASADPGTLLIDASTIRPDVARELHDSALSLSFDMLDAPVSGGQKGAEDAVLSIMVGGSTRAFERAAPVFDKLGTTVVHVGAPGSGQTLKAANQLIVAGTLELVAEAFVFLDAHGIDLTTAAKVLNGGLAGSAVLTRKAASMAAGDFEPGFRVDLHAKDLAIYQSAARAKGVFSPAGATVAELMNSLRATGGGSLDHSALLRQVSELSGRSTWSRK